MLLPLSRMQDRCALERGDSDVSAFFALLYSGELITKLLTAGMLAGVREDRDRSRYSIARSLVRADGVGEWANALDGLLTGPASQLLDESLRPTHRQLVARPAADGWEREALVTIFEAAQILGVGDIHLNDTTPLRQWFQWFATIRNKTRGHGAPLAAECVATTTLLERSTLLMLSELALWSLPWAHLYRNLSGKYRVSMLGGDAEPFNRLKSSTDVTTANGVYIASPTTGARLPVELLYTDADLTDFELPNGGFRGSEFETISFITNARTRRDGSGYLSPAQALPPSDTQGQPALVVQGNLLANLPTITPDYVGRIALEDRLASILSSMRHEIVTLAGPGGAGKTSLALQVLWRLCHTPDCRFASAVWFSARDIDLTPSGPKEVRPHGVTLDDFAREFVALMEPAGRLTKGFKSIDYLATSLQIGPLGSTLFVFDNFETVIAPAELFRWIDTYIRPPNKILITTRTRDFAGDYAIEVMGMTDDEANELIAGTAGRLGIASLLSQAYVRDLISESGGHPYVLKIMLGEVAREGRAGKPDRIIAGQEHILQALFERTYNALTPSAQRLFLLIASWRSVVPSLALEAVALRSAEERIDVRSALTELTRLSLVEEWNATDATETFVSMPLAAMRFGRRKLNASPWKSAIELDSQLLQAFGAAGRVEALAGVLPRIRRLLASIATDVSAGRAALAQHSEMLDFIGHRVPAALPEISRLYAEQRTEDARRKAIVLLRQYIESGDQLTAAATVWGEIASLSLLISDDINELRALAEISTLPSASVDEVSKAAFKVNSLLADARRNGKALVGADERKLLLTRVADSLERRMDSLDATDLSRLAWLHLSLANKPRAALLVTRGLQLEATNEHCLSLARRGVGGT